MYNFHLRISYHLRDLKEHKVHRGRLGLRVHVDQLVLKVRQGHLDLLENRSVKGIKMLIYLIICAFLQGKAGADGEKGREGSIGAPGAPGAPGPQGLKGARGKSVQTL